MSNGSATNTAETEYTPKNILITGGADYCSCLDNLDEIKYYKNYKFVKGNICSSDLVNYVLEEEEIDTIMHFAAQTHVDNSFGNSFSFTQNNILGTHVLLESAKVHGIKRFIHVSTDEVYGEGAADQEPMFEDQVLEYPEKLIPKFVNLLMRDRPVTLHGNGLNTRNFLYVEDVARAFEVILHRGVTGKIYNIGGTNEKANIEVAKDLIRLMGHEQAEEKMLNFVEDRAFNGM
eukprot:evm.model.NODE_34240_length_32379_cov_28.507706.6